MSKQNYTIFINHCAISLIPVTQKIKINISIFQFKKYVYKCLLKGSNCDENFKVKTSSLNKFINSIKNEFKYFQAAGGIVEENDNYLYIKRFNQWDLPKGKVENNETIREAAIREVEEECGVKNLKIVNELPSSYHIYMYKGKPALKKTYWFKMYSTSKVNTLVPQTEEGITELKFDTKDFLLKSEVSTYDSLRNLIKQIDFN